MRAVIIGAGNLGAAVAAGLAERGQDVIMVESDNQRIAALTGTLDCAFIHGDGSRPSILGETGPAKSDVLLCLTGNDQVNIIATLVGRSLGFARIITKIEDPEYEHLCVELAFTDVIIPDRHVARTLADLVSGTLAEDYSTFFKGAARLFSFAARAEDAGEVEALELPADSRVICLYRDDRLVIAKPGAAIRAGDQVVVLATDAALAKLRDRFAAEGGRG
ncbi:MAG TPA: NAD-binding protein [Alphaproteobacteria bacterium]